MYLVLSGTFKKKIRYGKASPWCCFHVSIFPTYKPPFLSPLFSGVCVVPGPLSCQLLCPGGELHKDLQHDSFLNLLPTVPNQPLIMRHVQQENNVAHSLSDRQMRQSLPTHWYVNQPVAFEMLLGFFSRSVALQNHHKVSLFGSNSVGISSWRSFWAWTLCWLSGGTLFVLGTNRLWRLEAWPPFFADLV